MKYGIIQRADEKAVSQAKKIEEMLKHGMTVKDECGGTILLVAWPIINGEIIREGESMLLFEGSAFDCIRQFIRCRRIGRENFTFGWPKDLVVTDE